VYVFGESYGGFGDSGSDGSVNSYALYAGYPSSLGYWNANGFAG
jgi:hypothetical protein